MSQMPPMDQIPPQGDKSSKTVLIVITAILAVMILGCVTCAGVVFLFGETVDTTKSYYPECETLTGNSQCQACCQSQGHAGHVVGEALNEPGKSCGCMM